MGDWRFPQRTVTAIMPPRGSPAWEAIFSTYPRVDGSTAIYVVPTRTRWVLPDFALVNEGIPDSVTALARRYVWEIRRRHGRCHRDEVRCWENRRLYPPMLVIPGAYRDVVLIDLRWAYGSILARFGVMDIYPFRWWSFTPAWFPPSDPGEEFRPGALKAFYRFLPTAVLGGEFEVWVDAHWTRRVRRPPIDCRPWTTVCCVLQGIAWFAARLGAVYINNDAFMLPAAAEKEFTAFLDWLGLPWHVEARGHAIVRGRGNYVVLHRDPSMRKITKPYAARTFRVGNAIPLDTALAEWCHSHLTNKRLLGNNRGGQAVLPAAGGGDA